MVVALRNAVAAGLLVALAVLYAFEPTGGSFYPTCLLYDWTGILCPGCGGLRATHHLLHGEVAQAFRFNPLLVVVYPALAYGLWRVGQNHAHGRPLPAWLGSTWGPWVIVGVASAYMLVRNLPGFPWKPPT